MDTQKAERKQFKPKVFNVTVIVTIFAVALAFRIWRLDQPNTVVHDEVHTSHHISLYLQRKFHIDGDPPLAKLLYTSIAAYNQWDGNWTMVKVGVVYPSQVPVWSLRLLSAVCGSLLAPLSFLIMLQLKCDLLSALIAPTLVITDNALLTQSRFMFVDAILLLFITLTVLSALNFLHYSERGSNFFWWFWLINTGLFLGLTISSRYIGLMTFILVNWLFLQDIWKKLPSTSISHVELIKDLIYEISCLVGLPFAVYCLVFYIHLTIVHKSGPHDDLMTSSFQATLQGGLSSLTDGQPEHIVYGSQITLRPTHEMQCWLHSYHDTYPVRYSDGRGSSHQQLVTCCTNKTVNNWWLIKHPQRNYIHVDEPPEPVKHGDIIQLVHGMTSRALNSHDVGAPVSPQFQEVSCYIDYNISAPAMNVWKVDITNREKVGPIWRSVMSEVRFIHVNSTCALKVSGAELPSWGQYQYEVVADKFHQQGSAIWNVEEHKYIPAPPNENANITAVNQTNPLQNQTHNNGTLSNKTLDKRNNVPTLTKSRDVMLLKLGFWAKLFEVQMKMFSPPGLVGTGHMYSSKPVEWFLCDRNVAYWKSVISNKQIYLLGNLVTWYSVVCALVIYLVLYLFYLMRIQRNIIDLSQETMGMFFMIGNVCLLGYLLHVLPYTFLESTVYLQNYLPALLYGIWLITGVVSHIANICKRNLAVHIIYRCGVVLWILYTVTMFTKLWPLSYGHISLSKDQLQSLMMKEGWDFIV